MISGKPKDRRNPFEYLGTVVGDYVNTRTYR